MKKLINEPFPILKTKRLVLDKLKPEDADAVFRYQSDKANFPYVDMPVYDSISQAVSYIEKMNAGVVENQWIIWAIRADDKIIGSISLWNFNSEDCVAETGYGLFSDRGNGYMSEALLAVRDYGLNVLELNRIEAFTNKKNESSISLLKRCGFVYSFDFLEEYTTSGEPMEMVVYKSEV